MDVQRRRLYLKAIGIDGYVRRSAPDAVEAADRDIPAADDGAVPAAAGRAELPASPGVSSPLSSSVAPAVPCGDRPRQPSASGPAPGPAPAPVPTPAPPASPSQARLPAAVAAGRATPAAVPADWPGLRAQVQDCERCKLCATRTQTVFGVGVEDAPLMVVGEGPGADEDARGEPFVGRAGQLLDQMLAAIGRSRTSNTYIANVVKCRPPGNRDPEADEVEACRPFLDRQIELVKPRLIVALGRVAAQRLLQSDAPLSRMRGPVHHYGAERTPVLVTYHPAYLLRSPREKAKSWDDLKRVHQLLVQQP